MAYDYLVNQLQLSTAGFITSLLEGVFAFCILAVVMFIGIWIANLLGMVLKEFFKRIKLEKFLEGHGVHDAFLGFTLSGIAIILLKLYVVVAFLGIAANVVMVPMLYMLAAQALGVGAFQAVRHVLQIQAVIPEGAPGTHNLAHQLQLFLAHPVCAGQFPRQGLRPDGPGVAFVQ